MKPLLYIGNRRFSSWSLRAWLALRWAKIEFDERIVALHGPGAGNGTIPDVVAVSPTGRLPVLWLGEEKVYDSLAIAEWANDISPVECLWPSNTLKEGWRAQPRPKCIPDFSLCEMSFRSI